MNEGYLRPAPGCQARLSVHCNSHGRSQGKTCPDTSSSLPDKYSPRVLPGCITAPESLPQALLLGTRPESAKHRLQREASFLPEVVEIHTYELFFSESRAITTFLPGPRLPGDPVHPTKASTSKMLTGQNREPPQPDP